MPAAVGTPIKSGVSASDISDAELPVSQSEKESSDDLEDMEKARAELLVRIVIFVSILVEGTDPLKTSTNFHNF